MSARREQNDSDGSWTWVDNEDDNFRKRAASRRASSYEHAQVEEVKDEPTDSDISILTDPEENAEVVDTVPNVDSAELEKAKAAFKEMAAEINAAVAAEIARRDESEIAVIERKTRAYLRSTLSSAGFMIGGLLIAIYCQWGCDSNITSPIQEYYDRPYDSGDVEYIQPDFKSRKHYHKHDDTKHAYDFHVQSHKNAKEKYEDKHGKRPREEHDEYADKKQKKGDFKQKKDDYKPKDEFKRENDDFKPKKDKHYKDKDYSSKEHNDHKKYKANDIKKKPYKDEKRNKHKEHEDYLYKKEAYLKQKEGKLKQKEFKLYAKDYFNEEKKYKKRKPNNNKRNHTSSAEWYDNMHKGRKDKRKQEEQANWIFDRAQGRDKKRDKAHWYFDMMDERETNRVKKS